jgi:cyclopropane fatty-acyl-phospholipid synthase-like methyltransferase
MDEERAGGRSNLPDPVVAPDVYTEHYYRNWCAGFQEWTESEGAQVAGIYPGVLHHARFRPGMVLVDVGTGRGEMLAVAIEQGASRAIGIEYAPAAVEMARKTLEVHNVGERAEVMLADARSIPLEDATADLVTMVDVVEHLSREELDRSLLEVRRILKPGGRVFIHTMPNRTVYDVTYKLQRMLVPGRRKRWPDDPRVHDLEREMHINEQTLTSMRGYLKRAGFRPHRVWLGDWVYTEFVPDEPARRLYKLLAKVPLTKRFGICDLFGEGTKP